MMRSQPASTELQTTAFKELAMSLNLKTAETIQDYRALFQE
ncbi:hypothetical protein ACSYAD_33195 [Acaryochloris marina NIES-2412]